MTVAHRIAVMNQGRLAQVAPPPELYEHPVSRWVAGFIGDVNLLDGIVVAADPSGLAIEGQGGRRYRALELLVKQKRMAKTQAVPCVVLCAENRIANPYFCN